MNTPFLCFFFNQQNIHFYELPSFSHHTSFSTLRHWASISTTWLKQWKLKWWMNCMLPMTSLSSSYLNSQQHSRVHVICLLTIVSTLGFCHPKSVIFSLLYSLLSTYYSFFAWHSYMKWFKTLLYVFHSSVYTLSLRDLFHSCVLKYRIYAADFQVHISLLTFTQLFVYLKSFLHFLIGG